MTTLIPRLSGAVLCLFVLAGAVGRSVQFPAGDEVPPHAAFDAVTDLGGDEVPDILAGTGPGRGDARVFSGRDLALLAAAPPFGPSFTGGIRVAAGDIDGDGVADVVTAMASGGGRVRAFSGATFAAIADVTPYGPAFSGGVRVALGDVDGDGRADVIVGPGTGAGSVQVYSGATGAVLASGTPFAGDAGGTNVAAGDVDGDGHADLVVAQARGGLVAAYSGATLTAIGSGAPYGAGFTGGIAVAVGDVNGDGRADIVTAPESGAAPVRVYDVATRAELAGGFPFGAAFAGGVRVAAADLDGDGHADLITAPGPGLVPQVRVFSGADQRVLAEFLAFEPAFTGGVEVAVPQPVGLRFTSASQALFTVGAAGSFTIRTEGLPPPAAITRSGSLPGGVSFVDNGDGTATISGTPDPGTGASYALVLTATNGAQTATQAFVLRVEEAPGFASAPDTTFRIGQAGSFQVITTGFPASDITLTGALPAGVTFVAHDGGEATLSGTPAAGTGGAYALTFTATNGVGAPAVQSFTLTVESGPAFTSPAAAAFVVGTAGTFAVTTEAVPTVTSIARTGTLPAGLSYTDHGDGTATVSGTPNAGSGGTYPQTLTATNGVGAPAVQTLVITVQQTPQITSGAGATFVAGSAGSFLVTTTGSPAPTLSVSGTLPAGVSVTDHGDGTATLGGTPGAGGVFPLTITAANGVGAPAVQSFTLTVQQPPAVTSAASAAFNVGVAGSFMVTTTGTPPPAISSSGALPGGVTFVDNGDGTATLSGTPAGGTGGTYPLTITATNGVGSPAVQSFSLIVQASPVFTSAASTTFTVGTPSSFVVAAAGAPAPTITATGTFPAGVGFTPATATLGGTPTETGTFAGIQFTAANGVPPDATQNFTLTVACPAITVSATPLPDGVFGAAYGPVTFTASGSTGSSLSWTATGLAAGLGIGLSSGAVTGSPTTTVLASAVAVTVTDEFGCTGSHSTSLTVRPDAADNGFMNGVGNTQYVVGATPPLTPHVLTSGTVLANDSGPGTLTAAVSTPASNGVVSMNADGTFVYTPNVGFAGPIDTFGYTLTDGNGVTDTATVSISLSGVVWYVNDAGANGDGRSQSPYNALGNAAALSQPGQVIFVHTGTGTTAGSLALQTGQTLWGQGAAFTLNGLAIPAAGRPTLGGTVTLASGVSINAVAFSTTVTALNDPGSPISGVTIANGVAISTAGAAAVSLSDAAGSFTFERITALGGSNAITLSNVDGPFSVTGTGTSGSGGTIQAIAGDAVRLSNTTGAVAFSHMVFDGIGDMAGPIDTVSGHDAIHGEQVLGGLALNDVTIRNVSDHAILGSPIGSPTTPTVWNGLIIVNSTIEDSNRFHLATLGDGGDEAMVRVLGLRGTVSVTGSTLRRGNEPLDLLVTGGSLAMTVTSSSFQAYKEDITGGSQPTVGQHCVDVVVQGTATATVTIGDRVSGALGNTFLNCRLGSVRVLHDTAATGTVDAVIARNTFTVDDHSSPVPFDFFFPMGGVLARTLGGPSSAMNVLALANTFTEVTNASGGVGQLTLSAEGGQFQARVQDNGFERPGNAPWFIRAADGVSGRIELRNNTVAGGFFSCPDPSCGGGYNAPGLRSIADVQRGGLLDLTIDDDVFAQHDTGFDPGNTVEIQVNPVGTPGTVCAALRNNQAPDGYALEQHAGTFYLYRWASSATGSCTSGAPGPCTTVLTDNGNTGAAGNPLATPPAVSVAGTITLTTAACQVPSGGIFQP